PFMVMPYMRKGNVREYLEANPGIDRLKILHDISLGLVHLHSQQIVHGDLKALNVLIDDGDNAVLCDFGLSRIIADATSRTTRTAGAVSIVGSRNWMAPERIIGGSLRKPCDIYAFSMTLFEVFTLEIPLGHINHGDFIELVVKMDVRPERPEEDEFVSSGLTNAVWEVAEHCWTKNPSERPTADALCDTLHH
ncbi:kinase-like protein, partial [Athelia psychrophila]